VPRDQLVEPRGVTTDLGLVEVDPVTRDVEVDLRLALFDVAAKQLRGGEPPARNERKQREGENDPALVALATFFRAYFSSV
jgi:hypothetical protein